VDVIEIDGASNNSVDDIRDLRERVKYAPSGGKYKVYIIDEVHMLSASAFNALLKTLEEPPAHVIFVLATTEMKKIPATVISRCQHMPFRRISSGVIRERLKSIAGAEGIQISSPALGLIARAADGGMRDSLTILDQLASFALEITEEEVKNLLGIADLGLMSRISMALVGGDRVEIIETIKLLSDQGVDIRSFTRDLVHFFRDLLVASVVERLEDILDLSSEETAAVRDILPRTSEDQLTLMLSEMMKVEAAVRGSSAPRLALEMGLIRTSFLSSMKPIKEVIEHIDRYREGIEKPAAPAGREMRERIAAPVVEEESSGEETASAEVPGVVPSGTGDERTVWERVLERLDMRLSSKLQQAEVKLSGDELLLTLNDGLFADYIKGSLDEITRTSSEEAGRTLRVTLTVAQKKTVKKEDLKEKMLSEPFIKDALELFEGRIVDISPVGESEK